MYDADRPYKALQLKFLLKLLRNQIDKSKHLKNGDASKILFELELRLD